MKQLAARPADNRSETGRQEKETALPLFATLKLPRAAFVWVINKRVRAPPISAHTHTGELQQSHRDASCERASCEPASCEHASCERTSRSTAMLAPRRASEVEPAGPKNALIDVCARRVNYF